MIVSVFVVAMDVVRMVVGISCVTVDNELLMEFPAVWIVEIFPEELETLVHWLLEATDEDRSEMTFEERMVAETAGSEEDAFLENVAEERFTNSEVVKATID